MSSADETALAEADGPDAGRRSRLRFELIFASIWLGAGLFLLPALIYAVGTGLLGPYGENQGPGAFYADFFGDLAQPAGRAWAIALGPLVLISLLRAVFLGASSVNEAPSMEGDDAGQHGAAAHNQPRALRPTPPLTPEPPPRPAASSPASGSHARVEPRVTFED